MLKGQPLKFGGAWTSADADPGPDFYLERHRVGQKPNNDRAAKAFIEYLGSPSVPSGTFNLLANDFKTDTLLALSSNVALQTNTRLGTRGTAKLYGATDSEKYLLFNLLEGRNNALAIPEAYSKQELYAGVHMAYATQLYWALAVMLESTARLDLGGSMAPLQEDNTDIDTESERRRVSVVADLASQHYRSYLTSGTKPDHIPIGDYYADTGRGTFYADNLVAAANYHPTLLGAYPMLRSIDAEKRARPRRFASFAHYEASTVAGNEKLPRGMARFELPLTPTENVADAERLIRELTPTFGVPEANPLARPSLASRKHTLDTPLHMEATQYTRDDGEFDAAGHSPAVLQVRYVDSGSLLPADRETRLLVNETTSPNAYYTNAYIQHEVMELHGTVARLRMEGEKQDEDAIMESRGEDPSASERLIDQLLTDASNRNPDRPLPMHPGDYLDGIGEHTFQNHWTAMARWEHTPFLEWHRNITSLLLQNTLNWIVLQRIEARTIEMLDGGKANARVEAMLGAVLEQLSDALLYGEPLTRYSSVFMDMYHEEEAVAEHTPILREEVITYILWTLQIQLDQERYTSSYATGRTKQPDEVAAEASVRNVHPEFVPPLTEGIQSERLVSLYSEMLSSLRAIRLDYRLLYEAIRTFWLHTTHPSFAPTVDEPRVRAFITTHLRNVFHRNFDGRDDFRGPPRAKKVRRPSNSATLGVFVLEQQEEKDAQAPGSAELVSRQHMARWVSRVITNVIKDLLNRDLIPTLQVNTVTAYETYSNTFFGKEQESDKENEEKIKDNRAVPISLSEYVQKGMVVRVNREFDIFVNNIVTRNLRPTAVDMFARYLTIRYGSEEQKNAMRDETDDNLSEVEDEQTLEATVEILDAFLFLNGAGPQALDLGQFYTDALQRSALWGYTEADLPGTSLRDTIERSETVLGDFPHIDRYPLVARYPKTHAPTLGPDSDQRPSPTLRFGDAMALLDGPFSTASMWASMRNDMPLLIMLLYDKLKYDYRSATAHRTLTLRNMHAKTGAALPLAHLHPQRALPTSTESISVQLPPNKRDARRWRANTFSSWIRDGPLYDRQLAYMHRMMKHDEFALAAERRDLTVQFVWERHRSDIEGTFTYVAPRDARLAQILWQVNGTTVRQFYAVLGLATGPESDVRWFKTKMRLSRSQATAKDTSIDRSLDDDALLLSCDIKFYWDEAGSFPSPVQCASYATVKAPARKRINSARLHKGPRVSDIMRKLGRTVEEERQLGMLREQLRIDNQRRKEEGREHDIIPEDARYYSDLYHHTSLYWERDILRQKVDQDLAPVRPYDTTNAYAGNAAESGEPDFVFAKVTS